MENKKRIYRNLPVKLTHEEIMEAGSRLADGLSKAEKIESEIKAYKQQKAGELELVMSEIRVDKNRVSSGEEYRDVEVKFTYNPVAGTKNIYRVDTGELVATEIMNPNDYQIDLELRGVADDTEL